MRAVVLAYAHLPHLEWELPELYTLLHRLMLKVTEQRHAGSSHLVLNNWTTVQQVNTVQPLHELQCGAMASKAQLRPCRVLTQVTCQRIPPALSHHQCEGSRATLVSVLPYDVYAARCRHICCVAACFKGVAKLSVIAALRRSLRQMTDNTQHLSPGSAASEGLPHQMETKLQHGTIQIGCPLAVGSLQTLSSSHPGTDLSQHL